MEYTKESHPYLWLSLEDTLDYYAECESIDDEEVRRSILRELVQTDLFYLGYGVCKRLDMVHPWVYARCREVQFAPDGYLDLWSREHFKSTVITFLLTIQDILNNPEATFGIFSHSRDIAKDFLRSIKTELETNIDLKYLFPDILYDTPGSQSPQWNEEAIIVKRLQNPKEATVEAWGLVDGMPTGRHFSHRVYDDLVTEKTVTNPEMIKKVTDAWRLSDNLGKVGGVERYIGTIYHQLDTYCVMMREKVVKVRMHPCTSDGSEDWTKSVLMPPKLLEEKRRKQGKFIFSCQMLLNPLADQAKRFQEQWLDYWEPAHYKNLNICIIVDPSSGKKRERAKNDYTSMWVLGRGPDDRWRVIDMVRDRLRLTERANTLMGLWRKYRPKDGRVFYENSGMSADIEHIQYRQREDNCIFPITEITRNIVSKNARIERLIPVFENKRILFPQSLIRIDWENKAVNLIEVFKNEEYLAWPILAHDDMLDSLSDIENEVVLAGVPLPSAATVEENWAMKQLRAKVRAQRNSVVV